MFTTTVCIVGFLFLSWWRTESEFAPDPVCSCLSLRSRCFHFCGWGGFEIRLARRRAHPCDEQVVAITCSFSLFFHVKVLVSILWVGPAVQTCPGLVGNRRWAGLQHERSNQRGEEEIRRSSINIMEICYSLAPTPLRNCRRRHGFLQAEISRLRAETENLPAESRRVSG